MDHGWNDPAVLLAIGCTDEDYYIVEESHAQHTNVLLVNNAGELEDCLVKRYQEMHERYDFDEIWADPSEPEYINTYRKYDLPVKEADNTIGPGIKEVASLFKVKSNGRPNLYINRECKNTIKETENYRWKKEKKTDAQLEEPEDKDNHTQDANRYAIYNDRKGSGFAFGSVSN
jgi:phage terminase large subunit